MVNKHTPGPWLLNHNTNWKTNPFSVTVRKYGVHSTTVANIPTRMTIPPQEQQANARLIAAAPDLLEALQAIIGHDAHLLNHWRVETARAAIAKATGEQT